jgi:hypothetical protein
LVFCFGNANALALTQPNWKGCSGDLCVYMKLIRWFESCETCGLGLLWNRKSCWVGILFNIHFFWIITSIFIGNSIERLFYFIFTLLQCICCLSNPTLSTWASLNGSYSWTQLQQNDLEESIQYPQIHHCGYLSTCL